MAFKRYEFRGFKTFDSGFPTEIPEDHFSDTLNMIRREDGLWENRKGIKQFGDDVGSGSPVHSLHFWKTSAGNRYLTVGTGTALYSYAEGSAYNDGSYTSRATLTESDQWDAIVYRDIIVLGNGSDDLWSSADNSTFTERSEATGPPLIVAAKFLEVGNDFVAFSGISSNQDQILFSSGAPTSPWVSDSNNVANVDIGNADSISGIKSLGDQLVVTKTSRTYAVALSDFSRTTLDWAGGSESNRAIQQTQKNALYIAGRQGIFDISKTQIGDNQLFGSPESQYIQSLYNLTTDYSTINGHYTKKGNYVFWNCDTTLGSITFLRNLDFGDAVWTYFKGINSSDWTTYEDSSGDEHILYGDPLTDKVWELFAGRDDNGAPILSRLSTKSTDFGIPEKKKRIQYIDINGYISKNAQWDVQVRKDDEFVPSIQYTITQDQIVNSTSLAGLGVEEIGTAPLAALVMNSEEDVEVFPFFARIPVSSDFNRMQVILENNQKGARVILRSIVAWVEAQPIDLLENINIL